MHKKLFRIDVSLAMGVIALCSVIGYFPLTLLGGILVSMLTTSRWSTSGPASTRRALMQLGVIIAMWALGGIAGIFARAAFTVGSFLAGFIVAVLFMTACWAVSSYINRKWSHA